MSSKFMAPDHTASKKSGRGSVRGLSKLSARSLQRLSVVERPSRPTTEPLHRCDAASLRRQRGSVRRAVEMLQAARYLLRLTVQLPSQALGA